MLKQKKMSKKRNRLMIVFILIIFGVIAYLLYDSFIGFPWGKGMVETTVDPAILEPKVKMEFHDDFFNKEPYKSLEDNREATIIPGKTGRENPFSILFFTR